MFFIEGISIRNFRSLRNVHIGRHWGTKEEVLPELVCCIGAPNTGKSEFWDVFSFIQDINLRGVKEACLKRGGLNNIESRDSTGPVEFEFILSDKDGNEYDYVLSLARDGYGNVQKQDRVTVKTNKERKDYLLLMNIYFSTLFTPEFTETGLRNTFDYSEENVLREDGSNFVSVLAHAYEDSDKQTWFKQHMFYNFHVVTEPAFDLNGNKGTKQIFALYDDHYAGDPEDNRKDWSCNSLRYAAFTTLAGTLDNYSLVRIQGLENGLYFTLQEHLAETMLSAAKRNKRTVILLTYSPQVLNMLQDKNVFIFYKDVNGDTKIVQASRVPLVHNMIQEGFQMGHLWTSEYLMPDQNGNFSESGTEE